VIAERTCAREARLQHVRPGAAGFVVTAERRKRHSKVPGRQAVKFGTQPAGRTAVVRHGHDGGQTIRDPPQGGQRCRQPVAATERDHRRK
jgi:hypothetical protein